MQDLQELYQTIIMDHNKRPRHYGLLTDFTHSAEGYNPICGDKIELRVKLEAGRITAVGFEAACCAICKASTSLMADVITAQNLAEVAEKRRAVDGYLSGNEAPASPATLQDELSALSGVSQFPARIKCAQLPWQTLAKALKDSE